MRFTLGTTMAALVWLCVATVACAYETANLLPAAETTVVLAVTWFGLARVRAGRPREPGAGEPR